jgi:hypothetical protein
MAFTFGGLKSVPMTHAERRLRHFIDLDILSTSFASFSAVSSCGGAPERKGERREQSRRLLQRRRQAKKG